MNGPSTYRDDLSYERVIIRVSYSLGQHTGDWAMDIGRQLSEMPNGFGSLTISDRALDDAVFAINELRDTRQMDRLRELRQMRELIISNHFAECARRLIYDIEKGEGWDVWLDRVR